MNAAAHRQETGCICSTILEREEKLPPFRCSRMTPVPGSAVDWDISGRDQYFSQTYANHS